MPEILSALGATNLKHVGSYIHSTCPAHRGDNETALTFYSNTGHWMCYTHGCHGDKNSADVFTLIQKSLGLNFKEAVQWLEEFLAHDLSGPDVGSKVASLEILKRRKRTINRIIPESYLDRFIPEASVKNSYYETRGYKKQTLKYFDVRYCIQRNSYFYNRAIIPIHDLHGNLIGVSGRWMGDAKRDDVDKFLHTKGMARSHTLYNWHRAQKYFDSGYVLLTESPGAVWGLHQIGRFNTLGCLGGNITEDQVKIIASNPKIHTTVLLFDSDEAGRKLSRRAANMLYGKTDVHVVDLTEGFDLDNIDAGVFLERFAARKIFSPDRIEV